MRHSLRVLLSVSIIAAGQAARGEESRWKWWPFSSGVEDTVPAPSSSTAAAAGPQHLAEHTPAASPTTNERVASAAEAPLADYPVTSAPSDSPPLADTPFPKFTWPKPPVTIPRPQLPQLWPNRHQVDDTRNAWVGKSIEPERPSPLQAVRNGAHRVAASTRSAWHKTVDTLTPGSRTQHHTGPRIAQRDVPPPFWKRMFTAEPERQDNPTISGFVGQPRP